MSTPLRRAIEQRSVPVLLFLRRLPTWVPFLGMLALLLGGLFASGLVGIVLLVVVALVLLWISYLGWPALPPNARMLRVVVVGVVVLAIVGQAAGW